MAQDNAFIELTLDDLRTVAGYATACAKTALAIFETDRSNDFRPHAAIESSQKFACGGPRNKAIRDAAWGAMCAFHDAREAGHAAAGEAARAAVAGASSAYLHPLVKATQVRHILGSAAHAARAFELTAGGDPQVGNDHIDQLGSRASPKLVEILRRYPNAPSGGGRTGELMRQVDFFIRSRI